MECGGHSDCVNSPEESQGYRCECQSGYEWNGNSCKLRGKLLEVVLWQNQYTTSTTESNLIYLLNRKCRIKPKQ